MSYTVRFKNKKINESAKRMPILEQKRFVNLVDDLENSGPIQPKWKNYSSLGKNLHHCHLTYKWVACWEYIEKENSEDESNIEINIIEVYYAGSRENAPY